MNVQLPTDLIESAGICQNCFIKFNEIDEHQAVIEKIQDELLDLFNSTQANVQDTKADVKQPEEEVEVQELYVNEVVSEEEYVTLEPTDHDEADTVFKKRGPKRKRNLDEGLIMVEVDGSKYYQCDVCRKVFKDRYKLKTHKETHTEDRNVCCTECGAMWVKMEVEVGLGRKFYWTN